MTAAGAGEGARPGTLRIAAFASGDFACNLYWQSVGFFLLFFYTDMLGLPPALAGLIYLAGSLWDGAADLSAGLIAERVRGSYRRFVAGGAVPLGIGFTLLYLAPPLGMAGTAALALVAQMLFRSCYALVNVPYVAWSTRLSADSGDRTLLSGFRMMFGTLAALLVALATPRIASWAGGEAVTGGGAMAPAGFLAAAALFAAIGTPILLAVGLRAPEALPRAAAERVRLPLATLFRALIRNRAFVTLNLAMAAVAVGAALTLRSVLYYFGVVLGDVQAGTDALAATGLAGALFVPLWLLLGRRTDGRRIWFAASAIGLAVLAAFALAGRGTAAGATVFLVGMQMAFCGFNLVFWAMLPETVDWGAEQGGIRVEALAFGASALVQKLALGIAGAVMGLVYEAIGYAPGVRDAEVADGIRMLMIAGPAVAIAAGWAAMRANPLRPRPRVTPSA